jgi:hypothetical protein
VRLHNVLDGDAGMRRLEGFLGLLEIWRCGRIA